jgi:hypothetical protein
MATVSQTALYNLDVTAAPDIMDLHEESGLDFGDGNIDLDLRSTGQQDDDLSIYDATTDVALDVQTVPTDQDDFMVDPEDVIEEDHTNYGDNDVEIADTEEQRSGEAVTANVEDDIIDYSDEEGDTMWDNSEHISDQVEVSVEDIAKPEEEDQTVVEDLAQVNDTTAQEALSPGHDDDASQHSKTNHEDDIHANDDDFQEFAEQPDDAQEEEDASNYIDQSNEAEAVNESAKTHDQVDLLNSPGNDTALNEEGNEQGNEIPQELHLHPVTVNYDSAELWLFKHHDYDSSGDFLVEDEDLASEPLSSLLEACRAALGADVTDDMELGFRLDNFHNIELYQEHTSCAFVTLEHLVNLYQQLHIQDGVSSPESFYMTLLVRPRVSALLNELSKAAAEGIGHSGLDRAIAAGLTAFTAHSSHSSTEHVLEDWDNGEEQQEQDVHEEERPSEHAGSMEDNIEHNSDTHEHTYEEHDEEHYEEQEDENRIEQASPPNWQSTGHGHGTPTASPTNNGSAAVDSRTPVDDAAVGTELHVDRPRRNSAHGSPTSHRDEDDVIDYSDEEADPEAEATNADKAAPPSSSSSTVQGDNALQASKDDEAPSTYDDLEDVGEEASNDHVGDEGGVEFTHDEENQLSYEGFDGSFGDEYVEENGGVPVLNGEFEEYSTEHPSQINDEDTNQYDDTEHENVEPPVDLTLAEHGDDSNYDPANTTTVEDSLAAADEFLDFDTATLDVEPSTSGQPGLYNGEDELEYDEDDEDGAAGQALVAVSAAAGPIDTLSSDLLEMSPQGQKRRIDEVGIDAGEATDSSGMQHCKRRNVDHDTNWIDQTRSDLECRLPPSSPSSIGQLTNPTHV